MTQLSIFLIQDRKLRVLPHDTKSCRYHQFLFKKLIIQPLLKMSRRYDEPNDDNDSNESFYGTAFPPLEPNQNAPRKGELDLTVRDERGRCRFHGAFTGG